MNDWQRVIDDELVVAHLGTTDGNYTDPRQALHAIIQWHVQVALDPTVSREAEALIERGRREAASAELCEQAELGRIAMHFVDRAGDPHPGIDEPETICAEFHRAMSDALMRMRPLARPSEKQ